MLMRADKAEKALLSESTTAENTKKVFDGE